jgi:thiaminase/transcriptional activator TenA
MEIEMPDENLSAEFRKRSTGLWNAVMAHPFVRGIGAGDLGEEKYVHYLKQDYVYLVEFARVFGLAASRSDSLDDMAYFAGLLNATLEMEMDLHRRTCADFGISTEELETVEPALVTTAYANLLIRTCYEGRLVDILAVLLPCECGYAEIAQGLKTEGLPNNKHFKDWIETYSSAEFAEFADWIYRRFDALAAGASEPERSRWYRLYMTSARFELLFFEMGWTGESWPSVVPR